MLKSTSRFVALGALFLIPIFPLIVANSYFFPFITGKAFYFRILVEVAFAAWVILAFADARYRPRINMLTIAVTVFALVALVADILGVNPLKSFWSNFERMEGWITILHLWMLYIASSSILGSGEESRVVWYRWINIWLVVAFIVGCYGFAQLFGWAAIHQGSARIDASLGNAAYMAVYMLMSAGMAAYLCAVSLTRRGKGMAWLYAILAVIFTFLLTETATRGTILGLVGGIMLALFLYAVLGKDAPKNRRLWSGGLIVLILVLAGAFWGLRNQPFIQKSEVLRRIATISITETQTQARAYIWPMAVKGWTERPVLGWGQENFNYIFNANYNPKMWTQEQWFDRAHSVFLDWLVAAGLVGLLAYLSLYVIALMIVWRSERSIAEKSILTGLIAGYAVHNIAVFDNLASYVAFFALLAYIGSALDKKRGDKVRVLGGTKSVDSDIVEYVTTPAAIVVLVVMLYFLNVRVINANQSLIAGLYSCASPTPDAQTFEKVYGLGVYTADQEAREQLVSCAQNILQNNSVPGPTKQAFFQEAGKSISDQIAATPKDARIYVLGGQFMTAIGQLDQAQPLLEKAHALTPGKQSVDMALANIYINEGKTDQGLALLRKAYESDPTYPDARASYALGLIIAGRSAEAEKMFNNDPAIFQSQAAGQTYVALKQYDKAIPIYQKLAADDPNDVNNHAKLAQIYYAAGKTSLAIDTLRGIETKHPEYKDQIEAAIKQIK